MIKRLYDYWGDEMIQLSCDWCGKVEEIKEFRLAALTQRRGESAGSDEGLFSFHPDIPKGWRNKQTVSYRVDGCSNHHLLLAMAGKGIIDNPYARQEI